MCHHAICIFRVCVCVCIPWAFNVHGGQFKALEPLELELEMLSQHVVLWSEPWSVHETLGAHCCPSLLPVVHFGVDGVGT